MVKLKRLDDGKVLRGAQIVPMEELAPEEMRQLEIQEAVTSNVDAYLEPGAILLDLYRIDAMYAELQTELQGNDFLTPAEAATYDLQIKVLSKRSALLTSLLKKTIADKKSVEMNSNLSFGVNTAEGIPDNILIAAMAGKLSEKELEALEAMLMADDTRH